MVRILVFEPNSNLCSRVRECLERERYWVLATSSRDEALEFLSRHRFHVCLWAVDETSGPSPLAAVKSRRPSTAFIATSAGAAPAVVVHHVRAGASHFWRADEELGGLVETVRETVERSVPKGSTEEPGDVSFPTFMGRHPRMLEIFQQIQRIKSVDSTVLITGESGTGKEVVARAIHDLSPRRRQSLVAINCGAIPPTLLESELFGHVKGAFTGATQNRVGRFQLAGQGTLFLDEIGDLPFDLQAKLLRALQNKVFEPVGSPHSLTLEARIIAATNMDLEKAVADKRFREDLYYRLNVIPISIPPLRTRKSDIPLLARHFLENFCKAHGKEFAGISEDAMGMLMEYHWPGNVRELENLAERVVVLKHEPGAIEVADLPLTQFRRVRPDRYVANVALPDEGLDFNEAVNEFENELILQALQRTDGNRNQAASLLRLNRTTLVEKLKRKGLQVA